MSSRVSLWVVAIAGAALLGYAFAHEHHWLILRIGVWGLFGLALLLVFTYPSSHPRSR